MVLTTGSGEERHLHASAVLYDLGVETWSVTSTTADNIHVRGDKLLQSGRNKFDDFIGLLAKVRVVFGNGLPNYAMSRLG